MDVLLRLVDATFAFAIVMVGVWWTTRMGHRMRRANERARRIHTYYRNGRPPADFDDERSEAA